MKYSIFRSLEQIILCQFIGFTKATIQAGRSEVERIETEVGEIYIDLGSRIGAEQAFARFFAEVAFPLDHTRFAGQRKARVSERIALSPRGNQQCTACIGRKIFRMG